MYIDDLLFDFVERAFAKKQIDLPVDIYQEGDNLVFEFAVAGYDSKNVSAELEQGVLTVTLTKSEPSEDRKYYVKRISRKDRTFKFAVPSQYDYEKAWATIEKGVLKIVFPKKESHKKRLLKLTPELEE